MAGYAPRISRDVCGLGPRFQRHSEASIAYQQMSERILDRGVKSKSSLPQLMSVLVVSREAAKPTAAYAQSDSSLYIRGERERLTTCQ